MENKTNLPSSKQTNKKQNKQQQKKTKQHTHTLSLSLSLSLSLTHTHTHTHTNYRNNYYLSTRGQQVDQTDEVGQMPSVRLIGQNSLPGDEERS